MHVDWSVCDLLAASVISIDDSECSPLPDSTSVAAVSTTVSVGGSVSAASPMSVNMNALECAWETVMSKASGPHDCEAYWHANKETSTSVGTGTAAGSLSGCVAGGSSMVVSNTFLPHPEASAYRHSHATVVVVMTVPVSSA